jgi:transposase
MDDSALQDYFLRPCCPSQRQYEALRAVFVEGVSQKDAAHRFGYSYGSFRQLVLQFRSAFCNDSAPPFSTNHPEADRPASGRQGRPAPTSRPSQTSDA